MQNEYSVGRVIKLIVKLLGIPVTRTSIAAELQRHPDPSSLVAISDLLDLWLIPNAAYNVSIKEILEAEMPLPFVACFKEGEFALVTQINTKNAVLSNDRWENHELEISEFRKLYRGTILAFQKDESSGEANYAFERRKEMVNRLRILFLMVGLAAVIVFFLLSAHNDLFAFKLNIGLILLLKSTGLAVSVLLLMQSLDANNPLIKKICGSDENQNCNAILTSKAAKIINELSWSEVGFFYFAGTWLTLLLNNHDFGVIGLLAIINLLSLPYSFYSIYYQWRVAKQWCIFCCSIQALLWSEFFAFLPNWLSISPVFSFYSFSKLFVAMLIPMILWVFIKPFLINSGKLKLLLPELYRFKYNKEFFKNIVQKEPKYILPAEEDTITIGNREANNVLTIVSSPFCHACADAHKLLDDLTEIRDDVKIQFVFLTRIRSRELDTKVLTHFMNLKSAYDDTSVKQALSQWYSQKDKNYESWQEKYPVDALVDHSDTLLSQKAWCKMVDITGTPTLFINGRKLPNPYRPEDLKYVI